MENNKNNQMAQDPGNPLAKLKDSQKKIKEEYHQNSNLNPFSHLKERALSTLATHDFATEPVVFKGQDAEGYLPSLEDNLQNYQARNQSWGSQAFNSVVGGVSSGILTAVEDAGYILDLDNNIGRLQGVQEVESNWLSNLAKSGKEEIDRLLPIYKRSDQTFDWGDSGFYWSALKGILDSAVGFGLVGAGAGIGVKALTSGNKIAQLLSTAARVSKQPRLTGFLTSLAEQGALTEQAVQQLGTAAIINYGEGKMMALETFDKVLSELQPKIDKGELTEDQARAIAGEQADRFQLQNMAFILSDAYALNGIFKGKGLTRNLIKEQTPRTLGKTIMSQAPVEYLEEVGQSMLQKEAEYQAKQQAGLDTSDYSPNFAERLGTFIGSDETQLEGLMGLLGGPAQFITVQAPFYSKNKRINAQHLAEQQDQIIQNVEYLKNQAQRTSDFLSLREEAGLQGQDDLVNYLDKQKFLELAADNFERGTTEDFEQRLETYANSEIEENKPFTEQANTLLTEFKALEKQWLRSSGYVNQREVFMLKEKVKELNNLTSSKDADVSSALNEVNDQINNKLKNSKLKDSVVNLDQLIELSNQEPSEEITKTQINLAKKTLRSIYNTNAYRQYNTVKKYAEDFENTVTGLQDRLDEVTSPKWQLEEIKRLKLLKRQRELELQNEEIKKDKEKSAESRKESKQDKIVEDLHISKDPVEDVDHEVIEDTQVEDPVTDGPIDAQKYLDKKAKESTTEEEQKEVIDKKVQEERDDINSKKAQDLRTDNNKENYTLRDYKRALSYQEALEEGFIEEKRKSFRGSNLLAYLSRNYDIIELGKDSGVVRVKNIDNLLNDKLLDKNILDPSQYNAGTKITFEVDIDLEYTNKEGELITYEKLASLGNDFIPIVAKKDGIPFAHLHIPEWINQENIEINLTDEQYNEIITIDPSFADLTNLQQQEILLEQDREELRNFRNKVIDEGIVESSIVTRSIGKLLKTFDGEHQKLSEAFPDKKLPLGIVKDGLLLKNNKKEIIKGNILNRDSLPEGIPHVVIPVNKDTLVAVPVHHEYLAEDHVNAIIEATKIFLEGPTDQNKEFVKQLDYPILTEEGLRNYIRLFTNPYNYNKTTSNLRTYLADVADSSVTMIDITGGAIEFGRGGGQEFFAIRKESPNKAELLTKLKDHLKTTYNHVNLDLLDSKSSIPLIKIHDQTRIVETESNNYNEYIRDHLKTNLYSVNIGTEESPNYVYTIQPILTYDLGQSDITTSTEPDKEKLEENKDSDLLETPGGTIDLNEDYDENESFAPLVSDQVEYTLRAVSILQTNQAENIFNRGKKNNWSLDKILTELQVPKDQKELIKDKKLINREDIITSLLANNTFTVEINSSIERYYSSLKVPGGTNYTENEISTPDISPSIKGHAQFSTNKGIGWFRSDDKAELTTDPDVGIIKKTQTTGDLLEDVFGTEDRGISTTARRILEIQSDLFQKGRDKEDLINKSGEQTIQGFTNRLDLKTAFVKEDDFGGYLIVDESGWIFDPLTKYDTIKEAEKVLKSLKNANVNPKNQFLQLLNKNNNWVTFFVKSIIQDSAKKGYEKVLFPLGDTVAKIEGHETLEEFKKQKEDRIKELEDYITYNDDQIGELNNDSEPLTYEENISKEEDISNLLQEINISNREIETLKQELADVESGQTQLSSIAKFYENTITNILKKQGYNPVQITDEYGNKWNELKLDYTKDTSSISLAPLTDDQLSDLEKELTEGIIIRDLGSKRQRAIVTTIARNINDQVQAEAQHEKLDYNIIMHEWKTAFERKAEHPKIKPILDNWSQVKEAIKLYLNRLQTVKITDIENEDLDEESNLSKGSYIDTSITTDSKDTISARLRRFLAFIPDRNSDGTEKRNYLGYQEIKPFDEVYNTLSSILTNMNPSYDQMIERLNSYSIALPYMKDVIEQLESADKQVQNEFVVAMTKHYVPMKFLMWQVNDNGEYYLNTWDANSNAKSQVIKDNWINNALINNIFIVNDENDYVLNENVRQQLLEISNKWSKNKPSPKILNQWLNILGIDLSQNALDNLLKRGLGKLNYVQLFNQSSGVFGITHKTISQAFPTLEDIFNNSAFFHLARLESRFTSNVFSNSHKAGQKTVYSYSINKYITDRSRQLKENNDLLTKLAENPFSSNSTWLKSLLDTESTFSEVFDYNYISLEPIKQRNKKKGSQELDKVSESEHEFLKVGSFQSGKDIVNLFVPTMSDKSNMLTVTVPKYEVEFDGTDDNISDKTIQDVYESLVLPEINRMLTHSPKDIQGYNEGAYKFHFIPELNGEESLFINFGKENQKISDSILDDKKLLDKVYQITKEHVNKLVQKKVEEWNDLGITDRLDAKYKKTISPKVINKEQTIKYAAADYVINYLIGNANIFQTVISDPALFEKNTIEGTFDNIGKRLASLLAPGHALADSDTAPDYKVLHLADRVSSSSLFSYYQDLGIDPHKAYEEITTTDAQEFTTWQEHLYIMQQLGKISQETHDRISKAISSGKSLVAEDIRQVFQPMKPVYTNVVNDQGIQKMVYIKSSSIPLLPQVTQGTELEKLRNAMESNDVSRVAFSSAVKVGGKENPLNIWNKDGSINEESLTTENINNSSFYLPRIGFRIQQEIPYKDFRKNFKNEVVIGTQERKLLFQDTEDIPEMVDLKKEYNQTYEELYKLHKEQLDEELSAKDKKEELSKLQKLLKKEAEERGYPINAIEGLALDEETGQFILPLWATPLSSKYENLLNSIIENRIIRMKMNGKSYILATQEGFQGKSKGIVYTDKYDPDKGLQGVREDEKGNILPAQIILPYYIRDEKNRSINIKKFISPDGTLTLDPKLSKLFGFRIPTQGHNSMAKVEVVGFITRDMGDIIIAPREFITQMGSDFDIDKLNVYQYYTKMVNGKPEIITLDNIEEDNTEEFIKAHKNRILSIHDEVMSHPEMVKKQLKPLSLGKLPSISSTIEEYQKKDEIFSPLSDSYQRRKYLSATKGKQAVGIFALNTVFNATVQGKNILLKEDPVQFGNIVSDNNLSNPKTLKGDRFKSEVHSAFLSAAVDNEKEQILGKINVNEQTFDTIRALSQLGFEEDLISSFISQPAILEYVKKVQGYLNDSMSFTEAEELSEEDLYEQYRNPSSQDLPGKNKLLEFIENPLSQESRDNQSNILSEFKRISEIGKEILSVQSAIRIDSAGVGKFVLESLSKEDNLRNLKHSKLTNAVSLIEDSIEGSAIQHGLMTSNRLWGKFFPYKNAMIKDTMDKILTYSTKDISTTKKKTDLKYQIWNEMKASFYTTDGMFSDETIEVSRERLFGKDPLSHYLKKIENTPLFKNNQLLNKLNYDIKNKLIKYNASSAVNFDELDIYSGFLDLVFNDKSLPDKDGIPYSTRKLAEDLVLYSYLSGGKQQAIEFTRYIPVAYLKQLPFLKKIANFNFEKHFQDSNFIDDYFRNNPHMAPRLPKDIKDSVIDQKDGKTYTSSDNIKLKGERFLYRDENDNLRYVPYVSIYENGNWLLFKSNGKHYQKISTRGWFGVSEYNADKSLLSNNNVGTELVEEKITKPVNDNQESASNDNTRPLKAGEDRGLVPGVNPNTILRNIAENSDSEYYRIYAERLASKTLNLKIRINNNLGAQGKYNNESNELTLNPSKIPVSEFDKIYLHEITHALTVSVILNPINPEQKEIVKRLEDLRQELIKSIGKDRVQNIQNKLKNKQPLTPEELSLDYATYDLKEFTALMMTSKPLQDFFKSEGLWDKFLAIVRDMLRSLGIPVNSKTGQAINDILTLIDSNEFEGSPKKIDLNQTAKYDVTVDNTKKGDIRYIKETGEKVTITDIVTIKQGNVDYPLFYTAQQEKPYTGYELITISPDDIISFAPEIEAKFHKPIVSTLKNQIKDTYKRIANLNSRINSTTSKNIIKQLTEQKKEYKEKIKELEKNIETVESTSILEDIKDFGLEHMKEVGDILTQSKISDSQLNYAFEIVHLWSDPVNTFFTEGEKASEKLREDFAAIEVKANHYADKLTKIAKENITKFSNKITNQDLTPEELFRAKKDIGILNRETLGLHRSEDILQQAIFKSVKNANTLALDEAKDLIAELDDLIRKVHKKTNDRGEKLFNRFRQTYEDGSQTGNMIHRFSQEFFDANSTNFTKPLRSKKITISKINKAFNWAKNNTIVLDPAKLNDQKHIEEIKQNIGERGYEEYSNRIQKKLERYELQKEIAFERIDELNISDDIKDKEKQKWEIVNSPYIYADIINNDKPLPSIDDEIIIPKGYYSTFSMPKRVIDNKPTKWYDKKFIEVENDPDLFNLYSKMSDILIELQSFLPAYKRKQLQINTIPTIERTLMELFSAKGMKAGAAGLIDIWNKSIRTNDISQVSFQDRDPITGELRQNVSAEFIQTDQEKINDIVEKRVLMYKAENGENPPVNLYKQFKKEAQNTVALDKNFDLGKVLKLYSLLAHAYKHKSRIEDQVRLAHSMFNTIERQATNKAGDELYQPDGTPEIAGTLDEYQKKLNYFMEQFYGVAKPIGLVSNKKVYTKEEKETKKELEELLESPNLSDEEKEVTQKKLDELGGVAVGTKVIDNMLRFMQLKGMGWNLFSAFANMGFGNIANLVEASDGRNFNMKQFWKAQKIVSHSMMKNLTFNQYQTSNAKKLRVLMEKYNVLKEGNNELYRTTETTTQSRLKFLQPYQLQKNSEYAVQSPIMIAMMLNTEITDKNGNKSNLWRAYDVDGNLREEFKTKENIKQWEDKFDPEKRLDLKGRIDRVIEMTHGNYDPENTIGLKKTVWGRALGQFRTWALEGFAQRFETRSPDTVLGYDVEGRYRTLARFIGDAPVKNTLFTIKQLARKIAGQKTQFDSVLSDETDMANMRKNLTELLFLISLASFGLFLKYGIEDDDDKKHAINLLLNFTLRMQTDIMFYFEPTAFETLSRNAIPVMSLVTDTAQWFNAAGKLLIGEDEIEGGIYDGQSRFKRETGQLLPLTVQGYRLYSIASQQFD